MKNALLIFLMTTTLCACNSQFNGNKPEDRAPAKTRSKTDDGTGADSEQKTGTQHSNDHLDVSTISSAWESVRSAQFEKKTEESGRNLSWFARFVENKIGRQLPGYCLDAIVQGEFKEESFRPKIPEDPENLNLVWSESERHWHSKNIRFVRENEGELFVQVSDAKIPIPAALLNHQLGGAIAVHYAAPKIYIVPYKKDQAHVARIFCFSAESGAEIWNRKLRASGLHFTKSLKAGDGVDKEITNFITIFATRSDVFVAGVNMAGVFVELFDADSGTSKTSFRTY